MTHRFITAALLLAAPCLALAHGGHGLGGAHWHASDTAGLLLVGALAVLALWLARGGKR